MTTKSKLSPVLLVAVTLILVGCAGARPLHRPSKNIRSSLLKKTPVGTPYDQVEAYVTNRWQGSSVMPRPPGESWLANPLAAGNPLDHETPATLMVTLGEYWAFPIGRWNVIGFWLFDTNKQVSDVWVVKADTSL
jgi:hypothetical protein